jgi:hypothetical protein
MSIESLLRWAEAKKMCKADYKVVAVDEDRVFLIDLDTGSRTVTNDAEAVFTEIHSEYDNKRVVYRDTTGQWSEMLSLQKEIKFKFYVEYLPDGAVA